MVIVLKNPPANAGDIRDLGLTPGPRRSPGGGNGNPLQYSCLENPMDTQACLATVHSVRKYQTRLKQLSTPLYTEKASKKKIYPFLKSSCLIFFLFCCSLSYFFWFFFFFYCPESPPNDHKWHHSVEKWKISVAEATETLIVEFGWVYMFEEIDINIWLCVIFYFIFMFDSVWVESAQVYCLSHGHQSCLT